MLYILFVALESYAHATIVVRKDADNVSTRKVNFGSCLLLNVWFRARIHTFSKTSNCGVNGCIWVNKCCGASFCHHVEEGD